MSPYIIKQKKFKLGEELVAPIFLNQDNWYSKQLAYQELERKCSNAKDKTEKGLRISKEILANHVSDFMKDIVCLNLNRCGIQSTPANAIEIILQYIPIYVVCKDYDNKLGETDAYGNFKDKFKIPNDMI